VDRTGADPWPVPIHAGCHEIRTGLNDDQRGLASRYLPMAESLANAYHSRRQIERDELQSTAYLALVEAARNFDPGRKVNFATFARHRIRGALRDYVRFLMSDSWRGERQSRPAFQSLCQSSERHGRVIGINAEKPVGSRIESLEAVEEWLQRLPKSHALACHLIYIGGKNQEEVAQLLGLSRSHLSRIHTEALSLLIDKADAGRPGQEASQPKKNKGRPRSPRVGEGPTSVPFPGG
jgi:RNA polymerase sigma factor (sigma-70 family)